MKSKEKTSVSIVDDHKSLLNFRIKLGGKLYKFNLADELSIDTVELGDELTKQPSKYAWFATLHELAKKKLSDLHRDLKTLESKLFVEYRDSGGRTKEEAKATIRKAPRYCTLLEEIADWEHVVGILGVARESFNQRKEVLIAAGYNQRSQIEGLKKQAIGKLKRRKE